MGCEEFARVESVLQMLKGRNNSDELPKMFLGGQICVISKGLLLDGS